MTDFIVNKYKPFLCLSLFVVLVVVACVPNIESLLENGDVDGLTEALVNGRKPEVRSAAAEALGHICTGLAIDSLIDALSDERGDVRESSKEALAMCGDLAVDPLIESLKSDGHDIAQSIVDVLSRMDSSVSPRLVTMLTDSDNIVAWAAQEALIQMGVSAVEVLINALDDNEYESRVRYILSEIGEPVKVTLLEMFDADPENPDIDLLLFAYNMAIDDVDAREEIMDRFKQISDTAIPYILEKVKNSNKVVHDGNTILGSEVECGHWDNVAGILVDGGTCTTVGDWEDKIVLCETGEIDYFEKLEQVQASGGVGVIHYNSVEGNMYPSICDAYFGVGDEYLDESIVSVGLSQEAGQALLTNALGDQVQVVSDYPSGCFDVLVEFGETAIPYLLTEIRDPANQHTSALDFYQEAVAYMGSVAMPSIFELLGDSDAVVCNTAVEMLKNLEDDALTNIDISDVEILLNVYRTSMMQDREIIGSILRNFFKENEDIIADAAQGVCYGETLPNAAEYIPAIGDSHPMIILDEDGDMLSMTENLPVDWLPFTPEMLQLVICLGGENKHVVENCEYEHLDGSQAPGITRYEHEQSIILYAALTGDIIGSGIIKGSHPDQCPLFNQSSSPSEIIGGHIGFDEITDWLRTNGIYVDFVW